MDTRFSEDVVPLTDVKTNPGRIRRPAIVLFRPIPARRGTQAGLSLFARSRCQFPPNRRRVP